MSPFWVGVLVGLFLGANFGFVLFALCAMARVIASNARSGPFPLPPRAGSLARGRSLTIARGRSLTITQKGPLFTIRKPL